jgi:hypothetical protein
MTGLSDFRMGPDHSPEAERKRSERILANLLREMPMSGTVRAKFTVTELLETHSGNKQYPQLQRTIILKPQYDQKLAEDVSFCKATPSGKIEMQIDNPLAIERMPVGQVFYVDFTPVE